MIPLNLKDSALPAAVLEYTITNTGSQTVETTLAIGLQNFAGFPVTRC